MRARLTALLTMLVALTAASPAAAQSSASQSRAAWEHRAGKPAATHNGAPQNVRTRRSRSYELNRGALQRVLAGAPRERTADARRAPLIISLPRPDGAFSRFAIVQTATMEPGLAAKHPEIATFAGTGIDEPNDNVRMSLTSLGLQAAVRSHAGNWYIDPQYKGSESLYATYRGEDLEDTHGSFEEGEIASPNLPATPLTPMPRIDGQVVSLRQYRLAFLTDHTYAAYHGAANVTSAKVALITRVNQIYEDDFGIRLVLVANNDVLNLNTAAAMTGTNGPCGARACFTSAQANSCAGATLDRNHTVLGQLIGAGNYDVGHIGMGTNGGGLAYLGVVGSYNKGGGCTGVSSPNGDFFAIDYVAHELGHQFAGNHTFNGTAGSCGGNIASTAVEPGSGSSVMAYAGICDADDLQPNTDPYFSQQTISEVDAYTESTVSPLDEWQTVALSDFGGGDSFKLSYAGQQSPTTISTANYNATAIANAIKAIPGFPAGSGVQVFGLDVTSPPLSMDGFTVVFYGSLQATNVAPLSVTSVSGMTGTVSELDRGGPAQNGGSTVTLTANRAPVANATATYTIPVQTPFALTGTATDADGDALTYSWEQNDPAAGKSLLSNTKPNGPLFRQFHTASTAPVNSTSYSPAGQNHAPTTPTRVFPDMAQIAANNTNAASGSCPPGNVECFSEFLPTSTYVQPMHFRLSVRDGNPAGGGMGTADTTVNVATGAGPFNVSDPVGSHAAGATLPLTWTVANTNLAPVNAANVRITLSTDGGLTFPTELLTSTANDGSESVTLPSVSSATARIKVEAVGNVFFDISNSNFTITAASLAVTDSGDVSVDYSDAPPLLTVNATDGDGDGDQLQLQNVAGLPAGLSLTSATPSADAVRPGTRVWTLTGNVTGAPGTYPVTANVSDGTNSAPVSFSVTVTAEDATVAYSGASTFSGAQGATTATVPLQATVSDADGATGDLTTATVTFKKAGSTLCSVQAAANGVAACTSTALPAGTHAIDVVVSGGRYAGVGAGSVTVSFPAFTATDSGNASVQYSDALGSPLTVTGTDEDTAGSALTANAPGLPAGMSLAIDGTTANSRTWRVDGATTAAPGAYPVTVTVSDGAGHTAATDFTITVLVEAAGVSYTGDTTVTGAQGASTASVPLEATVSDPDASPLGDLSTATVTFKKGATTLCGPVAPTVSGVATCNANLAAGAHDIDLEVGGRYTGAAADAGTVTVDFPEFTVTDSGDASVQYSDALGSLVTVTATDEDTAGSALTPDAPDLPAGMSLATHATTADSRTWRIDGATTAAPGAYPVTVTVSDGDGHSAQTDLMITVTRENVTVTDGTDPVVLGVEGAATSPVTLRAGLSEAADGAAGDLTRATVTFKNGADTLCSDTSVTAAGAAECVAQLPAGTTAFTIEAGDHYTGTGGDSVEVQAPAFSATDSGDATVQYSDLAAVTVSASDDNTPGADLVATPTGLPAGLSLVVDTTGAGLPGTRTWKLAGQALAAPGVYPVTVDVVDGPAGPGQHTTTTAFTITVTAEDADIAYTGVTSVTGEPGATSASVPLEATVSDADASAGDLTLAAVTFRKGATTLCGPVAPAASGVATCNAVLGAGSHDVDVAVGGRYSGALDDTAVAVSFPAVTQPPAPPAPPTPEPTVAPVVPVTPVTPVIPIAPAAPVIDLSKIGKTVKVKRGKLKLKLVCKGFGRCTGTLKLTAKIKRRTTTIGSVKFTIAGAQTKTMTIKLNAKGRRALRKSLAVKAVAGKVRRSFRIRK